MTQNLMLAEVPFMSSVPTTEKEFTAIDLLLRISDAMVGFRAQDQLYETTVSIELPETAFHRFVDQLKQSRQTIDTSDIKCAGFCFSVKKKS